MIEKTMRVIDTKYSKKFNGCSDCVHSEDTEEICTLRKCVHAFEKLKDCYVPKVETEKVKMEEAKEDEK